MTAGKKTVWKSVENILSIPLNSFEVKKESPKIVRYSFGILNMLGSHKIRACSNIQAEGFANLTLFLRSCQKAL